MLACSETAMSADQAAALDFIAIYGREFGVAQQNLHGDNRLGFSEFPARRRMVNSALKSMVLDGWVAVQNSRAGFVYSLSTGAAEAVKKLHEGYPLAYQAAIASAIKMFGDLSEEQLIDRIGQVSTQALRR